MELDPAGLSAEEIIAEAKVLGADGPRLTERGLTLTMADAQAVLGAARRARLEGSVLRKVLAAVPGEPGRYKPAELRMAIRTLERRLRHVEPEVAKLKAEGQDRGGPQGEYAATVLALVRLRADLETISAHPK
jgi:hypothetical protein